MADEQSLIDQAVTATLDKLAAEDPITGWRARRSRAIWDLYHQVDPRPPATGIAATLKQKLIDAGIPEDNIQGAGISYDSIREIVEGPRPR